MSTLGFLLGAAKPQGFNHGPTQTHTDAAASNRANLPPHSLPCESVRVRGLEKRRFAPVAALAALALAACADRADRPLSPSLGAAVASMDSQIIDPVPAEGIPEGSGARGAAAIKRYETGRVRAPPGAGTGSVGVGSGAAEDPPASNPGTPK